MPGKDRPISPTLCEQPSGRRELPADRRQATSIVADFIGVHDRSDGANGTQEDEHADDVDRDRKIHVHGSISPDQYFLPGLPNLQSP
jgi:hypothetical protein